jgi:exonuclease VII small subunit
MVPATLFVSNDVEQRVRCAALLFCTIIKMFNIMNSLKEKSTVSTVAKVNNTEIVIIENGEKRVAIKPICDALGVDFSGQLQRIKSDEILGSTVEMISTVGSDKKVREMQTIPFKFVFGWLFRIDSRKVKPEAKETVVKYQLECYDALYNHFTAYADFVEQKQAVIEERLKAYEEAKASYSNAHRIMKEVEKELKMARELTFSDYDATRRQLSLFKPDEMEG